MKTFNFLLPILALTIQTFALPTRSHTRASNASINAVLALITTLFPVNVSIAAIGSVVADAGQTLASTVGYDTTRGDINAGECGDVVVVFSRGTFEPGDVGSLVGPELFDQLSTALGADKKVAVQGVDNYPASVPEYLQGGSPGGSAAMAASVQKAVAQCPNSKIVMSGYSQGAQVVHNAATMLGSAMSSVSAVVTFGDPYSTKPVAGIAASKVLVVCHAGDSICQFGDIITLQHLTYAQDTPQAASFIASHL